MSEKQFVNGLRAFKPNDKAPDFVIANLEINKGELLEFLKGHGDKIKVNMKRSQKGTYYLEVDTWQANNQQQPAQQQPAKVAQPANLSDPLDDLPF